MTPLGARLAARFPARFPKWHREVYRLTRGLVGHRWTGYPCLLVTTIGRKSGQARNTVLTYVTVDGYPTVAGSNGGSDRPPAWLLNLRASPEAEVRLGRKRFRAVATELPPSGETFERAWASINQLREGKYDTYQASTDRPIPIIQFLPRDGATDPHRMS